MPRFLKVQEAFSQAQTDLDARWKSLGEEVETGYGAKRKMPWMRKRICELERHRRDDDAVTRRDASGAVMRARASVPRDCRQEIGNFGNS